ncbi:hypothetical protein BKA66DRAFT_449093 [Pyrenochaeta sp. MPI-SDFR-AT-0127]|nr:hypothetical protein BKA66DRAFT_449093 [Pyrenochaeta sp. MPI-SDFR-AT-0127]
MAPIDRREHRQQRVRGAGPSSVQASFGFNFGALGAQPTKQSSLPPPRSSRRTPIQTTPRGAHGSVSRHRSASVQRSGSSNRTSAPRDQTVTPQLGKRKRGSRQAQPGADEGEDDELSPDREETVRSIEKSRRVVSTISPIREEIDDVPDELSILDEGGSSVRKSFMDMSAVINGTPVSVLAKKRASSGELPRRTPIADRIGNMSVTSQHSMSRRSRSKSTNPGPTTPALLQNGRPRRPSASRFGAEFNTPGALVPAEESDDELSPPQVIGSTPRIVMKEQQLPSATQNADEVDVDELSSPLQPTPVQETSATLEEQPAHQASITRLTKRGRPPRVIDEGENQPVVYAAPARPAQRGRPANAVQSKEAGIEATPITRKPKKRRRTRTIMEEEDVSEADELSPETAKHEKTVVEVSDAGESSEYEEPELEEVPEPTPQLIRRHQSPKQLQRPTNLTEKPPRQRQKFTGPKHAISVMRIKGSTVRGITVADTTRTILEETIDYRLNRMAEKLQSSSDSSQRKDLRSEINLSLSFKESLNEKLLDLQDANDILSTNFKKMKLFKRDNAELRKDILGLQNARQEVALEHDDVQADFEAEKARVEARNTLSTNMFDIEAAIQNGREKARKEGRENEGPEIPLSMLLETVGRNVGSFGGGLLDNMKAFNGVLERAAGWLEGRA